MPPYSLFEQCDFSGKTVIPVALHAGSRFSGTIEDIAELEPGAVVVKDGFTVAASGIANVKVEAHPYFPETALKAYLKPMGTAVMAWYPKETEIGSLGRVL